MKYISTRGDQTERGFSDILLEGLAPDGGLYLPKTYPQVDAATLARWRGLAYADLAFEILSLYIDDIPADDLHAITRRVYTAEIFGKGLIDPQVRRDGASCPPGGLSKAWDGPAPLSAITPLTWLGEGIALQGLSNGPTLAFKDMAMQLLGALFEYELGRRGETLNILGATSGDTGSAAEYAMRGRQGVRVFMLSPQGRMSPFQQAQMFSLQDDNIHNIAVDGVFDDCQDIVKAVSNDLAFKREHRIGTVNSINWARLLAQVVYYFAGYFQATKTSADKVSFTVPSGNFGNVCAGHVARQMGLPIAKLVVATNENDVLDEFFRTGAYRPRGTADTHETSSPSMDISKASNFERFVFDLLGRDGARVTQHFGGKHFQLDASEHADIGAFGFVSGRSTHADRIATIRRCHAEHGVVIDPHTADGLKVALEKREPGVTMLVLETALPAKFAATIHEALGIEPPRPAGLEGIEQLPKRVTLMPAEVDPVKAYIHAHV
ncbi:MAG: threonine synthase [Roseateles sp.]|uniref:threonine synthase n=1 Tax=Roseateles sp. TaxID=1971397 RepID=UPI0040367F50